MRKNLIMGLAFGYNVDQLKPFVLSLRHHYQDNALFIVSEITPELQQFFDANSIRIHVTKTPLARNTCQAARYPIYLKCIEQYYPDIDNVLLTDIRDVVFQANPFTEYPKNKLEFFAEAEIFRNCIYNGPWVSKVYGDARLAEIADQSIVCGGTTMGNKEGIVDYLTAMIDEVQRIHNSGRILEYGDDQPVHNHIVYSDRFKYANINHNGAGPISTMHYAGSLKFDRKGYLLDNNDKIVPVVHQYDRCGPMSLLFLRTALGGTGKAGIKNAADYAVAYLSEAHLNIG